MDFWLRNMEDVEALVAYCKRFKDYGDIDIRYERYTVDGCSYLCVASLTWHEVYVDPFFETEDKEKEFLEGLKYVSGVC